MCETCRKASIRVQELRERLSAMRPGTSVEWKRYDALKARIRSAEDGLLRLRQYQHGEGPSLESSGKREKADPRQICLL